MTGCAIQYSIGSMIERGTPRNSSPPTGSRRISSHTNDRRSALLRSERLWRSKERLVIRAYNEAGCNATEVDVWDLFACLRSGYGIVTEATYPARHDIG